MVDAASRTLWNLSIYPSSCLIIGNFLSTHNQASGDGLSDAFAKEGNQPKDEGELEERGIRASWNMQGHFPICPSPCLIVETPRRNI